MPSRRITRALARIIETGGAPMAIRSDNGPEISSRHYLAWCIEKRIDAIHIQPGKPTQNAFVESFHGRLRDECLNVSWFWNLLDARKKISAWRNEYNCHRPHSALGYLTPTEFAVKAASPSAASHLTRPALPQGFPVGSAVAVAPAPALTQIQPCDGKALLTEGSRYGATSTSRQEFPQVCVDAVDSLAAMQAHMSASHRYGVCSPRHLARNAKLSACGG